MFSGTKLLKGLLLFILHCDKLLETETSASQQVVGASAKETSGAGNFCHKFLPSLILIIDCRWSSSLVAIVSSGTSVLNQQRYSQDHKSLH